MTGQSKRRRRQRRIELELWEAELRRVLGEVRADLEMVEDDRVPDSVLVAEVVLLAHPETCSGHEPAVPAPRSDLAAVWFRTRLLGGANTEEERTALARRIAPLPD